MRTCSTRSSSLASTSSADAVALHALAGLGHAAQPFADQPADGGGFDVFFAMEGLEQVGNAIEIETAGDDVAALAVFGDIAFRFVLVADFADDHFHQIFHGGEAGGVAVLVHHNHHVAVLLLHLAHQVVDRLGFRHQADGAHQFAHRARVRARSSSSSNMSRTWTKPITWSMVCFVDRNARILLVDHQLAQLLERGIRRRWRRCWAAASSLRAPPYRRTPPRIGSACGLLLRSGLLRCRRRSALRCSRRRSALRRLAPRHR